MQREGLAAETKPIKLTLAWRSVFHHSGGSSHPGFYISLDDTLEVTNLSHIETVLA